MPSSFPQFEDDEDADPAVVSASETARVLEARGAHIVMAVRNLAVAEAVRQAVLAETPGEMLAPLMEGPDPESGDGAGARREGLGALDPAPAGDEGRQIRDLGGSSRRIREQRGAPCTLSPFVVSARPRPPSPNPPPSAAPPPVFSLPPCDDCQVQQHMDCVLIPEKPTVGVRPEAPEHYYCQLCRLSRADPYWVTTMR